MLYAGGYLAQFIYNYNTWTAAGGTPGTGAPPELPSGSPLACFTALFRWPSGLVGLGMCVLALGLLLIMVMHMKPGKGGLKDERNFEVSDRGTYGTSGYMSEKEMEGVLELRDPKHATENILGLLGKKVVCLPLNSRLNSNIAVYGASGSQKSRAFSCNQVLQLARRGESMVITDTKSQLYSDLSEHLRSLGYTVKIFNLVTPELSDSWDALGEVDGNESMATIFADVIMANTGTEGTGGDTFWRDCEQNLLKALVLYVDTVYPEGSRTIGEVYRLITMNNDTGLNKMFDLLPPGHPARAPYNIYRQAPDTVRGGVVIGLGSRLQVFQNQMIRRITSYKEIDLELPGKEKCAYFCLISDTESTYQFLSSLFFSFFFIKLIRLADRQMGGRLPIPVTFVLDEFCNLGVLSDFGAPRFPISYTERSGIAA